MPKPKYKITMTEYHHCDDGEIYARIMIGCIETDYYINNNGRVFKIKKSGRRYMIPNIIGGYPHVSLIMYDYIGFRLRIHISIHRLVATAFIPNPDSDRYEVNHINGNKEDYSIDNLEWTTHSENMRHAYRTDLNHKGINNSQNIYTEDQIREVCELLSKNELCKTDISMKTDVSMATIDGILKGKKWQHIANQYSIQYTVKAKNTGSTKHYTDGQIELVCRYLSERKLNMAEISRRTRVGFNTVYDIKRHRTWTAISKKYKI